MMMQTCHTKLLLYYKKLVYWELSLEKLEDEGMHEILTVQKAEANVQFSKFIEKNYLKYVYMCSRIMRDDTWMVEASDCLQTTSGQEMI